MTRIQFITALAALTATAAAAEDYNLQSAFPKALPVLGPGIDRFADRVATLTDGEVSFQHLGAGELSPPFEIFDNVGAGAIPAGMSFAGYQAGIEPAAALFGSIPFGPDAIEYVSWVHHGGGLELWRELYAPYNVVPMPCGVIISEAAGWFTDPVESVADIEGLDFRIGGLGGAILAKLGANAVSIPSGEITTSLQTGRLDGTELSFPLVDRLMGFEQAAQNYLFPGWHQPSGFIEFYMNADSWQALSERNRTAIETACMDLNLWTIGTAMGAQGPVIADFRGSGVTVDRLPDEVVAALRTAADEVFAEQSEADAMFGRVLQSWRDYHMAAEEYRDLNALD
jgi:TRAP-type mannitol/chloroaromatic compound transport system substrate-binding protein